MTLSSLRVAHFRCIESARLDLDARLNFIIGPNGAGKTTLLETIHVLGRGRSFRARQNRGLVQRGAEGFLVSGDVAAGATGGRRGLSVGFRRGSLDLQIDGKAGRRTSELAAILPVHVVEPGMHSLVAEGPSQRRRFLDWGVFHVEHGYLPAWREYRRVLGQRNAALKTGITGRAFDVWTQRLIEAAARVDAARDLYMARWLPRTLEIAERLAPVGLTIELDHGGYPGGGFETALRGAGERDRRAGITHLGPHRAELKLRIEGAEARDRASRGQQKLIAAALILGQVSERLAAGARDGVLLVDDPAAELDRAALARLVSELERLATQTVATAITPEAVEALGDGRVFHVEQGAVRGQSV